MYNIGEYAGSFDSAICRNFDQERLEDAYQKGREVNRRASALSEIDAELRDIRTKLENKELEKKSASAWRTAWASSRTSASTPRRISTALAIAPATCSAPRP